MSKKPLNEVRRFMKLANLNANVSSNFMRKIEETGAWNPNREAIAEEEEEFIDDEIEVEEEPLEVEDEVEVDLDVDVEEEAVISDEEADVLIALGQKLAAAQEVGAEDEAEDALDDLEVADDLEDEAEDLEDDAAEDLEDAAEDLLEADDETLEEILDAVLGEDEVAEAQKYGGNEGDIPDADRKKKGHYGRGPKTKETAEEEGESDFGARRKARQRGRERDVTKGYIRREARGEDVVQEVVKLVRERLAQMAKNRKA